MNIEKIEIFGTDIDFYKLYGIYITSRKPKQTQNITATFNVTTLIVYTDYEYNCELQWLTKDEKERIERYIKRNNGVKIKINKKFFNEFEGGKIEIKLNERLVEVIANYEDITVENKGFFFNL